MVAPPTPPKLSYKGRKEREAEERAKLEQEEAKRRADEAAAAKAAAEEAAWGGAAPPPPRPAAPARAAPVPQEARPVRPAAPARPVEAPRAPAPEPASGEPSKAAPALTSVRSLQYAESPKVLEMGREGAPAAREAAPATPPPRPRRPPRPPKSPDMRPVWAGFVLVAVGLSQALWGLYAMVHAHEARAGLYTDVARWATFSAGFSALALGAFAVRGGLWSFRKERYDVVKWGAICGTICMWALWVPWAFGLVALLVVHRARDEYYPYYDPARDAPEWARPPPRPAGGLEGVGAAEGAGAEGGEPAEAAAGPHPS